VTHLVVTLLTAVAAFASTNIDDLVLVSMLFLAARTGTIHARDIVVGQYLGFVTLLVISILAAAGLAVVSSRLLGVLGLLPLSLGLRGLWKAVRSHDKDSHAELFVSGPLQVAAMTVANGGDNISVYSLLLRGLHLGDLLITVAVFLALLGLWCVAGVLLGSDKRVSAAVRGVSHWFVPAVFLVIGTVVLVRFGLAPAR
jgi:cadmium resistance protein CadD (predicted permease)